MFGFPVGAIPIDKESLRFMCAWTLLHDKEQEAKDAVEEWRRVELKALKDTYKEGESSAKTKERCAKQEALDKEYNAKLRHIRITKQQRQIKLMRRVAGPLAKLVEA